MTIQITFEYEAVEDALNALRRLAGEEASAAIEPAAPVSTPAEDEKLQPSGEQAVSPVAADPKPVSTRPVRADKGLGRPPSEAAPCGPGVPRLQSRRRARRLARRYAGRGRGRDTKLRNHASSGRPD